MLLLKCPNCGNNMKYMPSTNKKLAKKRKKCVYCGHSFSVTKSIIKKLIN